MLGLGGLGLLGLGIRIVVGTGLFRVNLRVGVKAGARVGSGVRHRRFSTRGRQQTTHLLGLEFDMVIGVEVGIELGLGLGILS